MNDGYWYLATPYTKYPKGVEAAFVDACRISAKMLDQGYSIYCPIAHTHSIAQYTEADALDGDYWIKVDHPMMEGAKGLMVIMLEGWLVSDGIAKEIARFKDAGKRIVYIDPSYLLADL